MRLLVVGAGGFLGRAIVSAAVERGHLTTAGLRGEPPAPASAHDVVVWAAGARDADGAEAREVHAAGPARMLAALRPRRFVLLGTAEVYGDASVPFREADEPRPRSEYGRMKLAGERAMDVAAGAHGIEAVTLRIAVAYGPGQRSSMLIPALLEALVARRPFPMTSGEQTRDFVHARDVAAAVVAAAEAHSPPSVINVGSGEEHRVVDVARQVVLLASAAYGDDLGHLLEIGARPPRAHEQLRYRLDISRARASLGWQPRIPLRDGLAETAAAAFSSERSHG